MEIKIFGKSLFEAKKSNGGFIYNTAINKINESKYLPDFFKETGSSWGEGISLDNYVALTNLNDKVSGKKKVAKKVVKEEPKDEITPKGVYQLKTLNDDNFQIKVDPAYLDEQIGSFKDKLGMIKSSEFDMNRGTIEIGSMLQRLENRRKYEKHKDFYEQFPYTTTAKMNELVKIHSHLKIGQVEQFLADMPKEASDVMKEYIKETEKLCGKKVSFYIIANKKDFEKTEKRRDPILLAQSPFGHFWQILGAWDEEMLLLEEL